MNTLAQAVKLIGWWSQPISTGTPTFVSESYHDFSQSTQANSDTIRPLGHNLFLPYFLPILSCTNYVDIRCHRVQYNDFRKP